MLSKKKYLEALDIIMSMYPDARGELNWGTPFQLLIATILSAQATDIGVNKATPALFAAYPDAESLAKADIASIESKIKTIGLYHTKAKNIKAAAQMLVDEFDSVLPQDKEILQKLPGVGRKTANVVLGDAFGIPGIAVDTHVDRVSKRLNIVPQKASVLEVEKTLMRYIPQDEWVSAHHHLIFFGRYHCTAKNPNCENCPVLSYCKFGKERLGVID
ncbi:endonuclease III [Lactococcus fujiensis]|uniref:Endonuclease III n=1 Tax=Lactococcus fujiensis JCM 16395 TaxID=1291764 RepID=A0A2A5RK17_9LACT|nr:endonuclease III [Lactococcus fujiensis]PCR99541.1 endonuclease III [Lactococcus fujiensis JCM 16395]